MAEEQLQRVKDRIEKAIASFKADPPPGDFQAGYLAALEIVLAFIYEQETRP
jgi:hypothetical protein